MRKPLNYNQIIHVLQELHKSYPSYNMGRHIATALDGYGDVWGIKDKEFLFALEKYKAELDMDIPHTDEKEIDEIIKQGMNLETLFPKDDDEDEY